MEDAEIYNAFQQSLDQCNIDWQDFQGSTILITGANGLIGKVLIRCLLYVQKEMKVQFKILALVRNESSRDKFRRIEKNPAVKFIIGDVTKDILITESIDYIIHAAAMTQSKAMVDSPVEVIRTNIYGTQNVLELARQKNVRSMIYLSSMEIYGFVETEELLGEDDIQYLNPLEIRSSYPESKRMAECLCAAYAHEYQVPVKIIRLAQTFGYGVGKDETRFFAECIRCAAKNRDIELVTDGASKRMYLDTLEAVTAILTVLLTGENGQAYNAANKDTYCSVFQMAEVAARILADKKISVKRTASEKKIYGKYPPPHRLLLDVTKLEKLGWKASVGLEDMFLRCQRGMES